jgi:hypothetical protein
MKKKPRSTQGAPKNAFQKACLEYEKRKLDDEKSLAAFYERHGIESTVASAPPADSLSDHPGGASREAHYRHHRRMALVAWPRAGKPYSG